MLAKTNTDILFNFNAGCQYAKSIARWMACRYFCFSPSETPREIFCLTSSGRLKLNKIVQIYRALSNTPLRRRDARHALLGAHGPYHIDGGVARGRERPWPAP